MEEEYIVLFVLVGSIVAFILGIKWFYAHAIEPSQEETWLTNYKYAHRGLYDEDAPENSLKAIGNAIEAGYAIELDVRLTKDKQVVAFHDNELKRMTGVEGRVRDFTLEELRMFRLNGTNEKIPTLNEILQAVDGKVPILFEMKSFGISKKLEQKFYSVVKNYNGKYAVQSFSPYSLRWFRRNAPEVLRGQLSCDLKHVNFKVPPHQRVFLNLVMYLIKRLETNFICRPNFISYEFHRINTTLLQQLRKKGACILAWTISNEEQFLDVHPFIDSVIFESFLPEAAQDEKFAA